MTAATKNFDLRTLAIAQTADMPVRDAGGEIVKNGDDAVSITFHSPGSKAFQKAKHARDERNSTRVMARMQGKSEGRLSADEALAERAEFLAACTVTINNATFSDKRGHEGFKALFSDLELGHIADDAEKFLGERGNFKQVSATT
ncbi:MAG: hypothetical protein EOO22_14415 [Comamonadaceae bacterium]|nr:MAG: hypothetical protein EOO22_14415 [Comamonadaceae bacterium]